MSIFVLIYVVGLLLTFIWQVSNTYASFTVFTVAYLVPRNTVVMGISIAVVVVRVANPLPRVIRGDIRPK